MSAHIRDADLGRDRPSLERFIVGSNTYEAQFESDRRLDAGAGADYLPLLVDSATNKRGRIFIAEEAGVPIGWAVCYVEQHEPFVKEEERPYGYVSELFVVETHRGRHVGRDLLNACEDHFRALGLKTVLIGALSPNARAVNAYRAAGYADYAINLRKVL
ncbi:MAG: GNAT family N-acetyltransferase [Alphaproteobacteria bacterium]|nr:GNAT family N-acetyltransferase [Alphaproteobacteria bacterium]